MAGAPLSGDTVTIGRSEDNDLVVNADTVSKHHARLERAAGGWLIRDLRSRNGTLLNGAEVAAGCLLTVGDRLTLGEETLEMVGPTPVRRARFNPRHSRAAGLVAIAALLIVALARPSEPGRTRGLEMNPNGREVPRARRWTDWPSRREAAGARRTCGTAVKSLLREAQRARTLKRFGEALRLARQARALDPDSMVAQLFVQRVEGERSEAVVKVRVDAALAVDLLDAPAYSAAMRRLYELLDADDPTREDVAKAIARALGRTATPDQAR